MGCAVCWTHQFTAAVLGLEDRAWGLGRKESRRDFRALVSETRAGGGQLGHGGNDTETRMDRD